MFNHRLICFLIHFLGATLASIEDLAESNFLTVSIEPLADKTSGFWAGIYRNMDGNDFNFNNLL